MQEIKDRLQWARKKAKFKTPTDAAKAFGWTVSTYLGHENGDRNPSRVLAKKYARAFKVRWEWLLEGEGSPGIKGSGKAPAVGYVGAGAEVQLVDDHAIGAGLEEVDIPPGVPENAVLVIVRGDSMYPRYFDGEYLFYVRDQRSPLEFVGRECVMQLSDGRVFVKLLRKGSGKGLFNLESWNSQLIEDQKVEWAAPVIARVNREARR